MIPETANPLHYRCNRKWGVIKTQLPNLIAIIITLSKDNNTVIKVNNQDSNWNHSLKELLKLTAIMEDN